MKKILFLLLVSLLIACLCGCSANPQSNTSVLGGASTPAPTGGATGSASCLECANAGLDSCRGHDCLVCEGKGYSECYAGCNGGCDFCDGGYVDCACDNGKIYYGSGGSSVPTDSQNPCNYCENGKVTCSMCDGSGRSGTYTVGGFDGADGAEVEKLCNQCFGAKTITCSYCGGDGEL